MPGEHQLCVLNAHGSGDCSSIEQAGETGEVSSRMCVGGPGTARISGLLPDAAQSVVITGANGYRTEVPLDNNGYRRCRSVRFAGDDDVAVRRRAGQPTSAGPSTVNRSLQSACSMLHRAICLAACAPPSTFLTSC